MLQEQTLRSESGQPPSKRPRPTLRPHSAPHVVRARETASSSRGAAKPAEFGELLLTDFSTGKSSAAKVVLIIFMVFLQEMA